MEPFIGQIILFGGNFAPRGWAFCDGQILSIQDHTALFSVLGDLYGGDGRKSFALPDLRGRTPIHAGWGSDVSAREVGQKLGSEATVLREDQLPAHSHGAIVADTPADSDSGSDAMFSASQIYAAVGGATSVLAPQSIALTGSSAPIDNMQPSLVMNYIIAVEGVFPMRN